MKTWRLPTLGGRWLLAFRIFFLAVSALAIASQIEDGRHIARDVRSSMLLERVGLMPSWGSLEVRPFGDAKRAGVRDDDRIVAIDHRPLAANAKRTTT